MPSGITSPAVNMTVGLDFGEGPSVPTVDLATRVYPTAIPRSVSAGFDSIETKDLPPDQVALVRDAIRHVQNEVAASESWQREFLGRFCRPEGSIMGSAARAGSAEERAAARDAAAGLASILREVTTLGQVMSKRLVMKYPEPDSAIFGPEEHPVEQDPTFMVFDEVELL